MSRGKSVLRQECAWYGLAVTRRPAELLRGGRVVAGGVEVSSAPAPSFF